MRIARLLPALAAACLAAIATAQEPADPGVTVTEATLFFPRTVARDEERGHDGTATWRMIDLGPTRALEAVVAFDGADAGLVVLIEENPFGALPDDILIHAWPQWPATADGPAVASAYVVGIETADETQFGLIGTARGDWTIGLMASAAARNHERLRDAAVLIVELGLPDGKAYAGLRLGAEEQQLLDGLIPAARPALPFGGDVEQRILGANAPGGTGGVIWDTPHDDAGAVDVRGRVYLYERGAGFDVVFSGGPESLVVTVSSTNPAASAAIGAVSALSVRTGDAETALPAGTTSAGSPGASSTLTLTGDDAGAALEILRAGNAVLTLHLAGADGSITPIALALPQSWNPFAFLQTTR